MSTKTTKSRTSRTMPTTTKSLRLLRAAISLALVLAFDTAAADVVKTTHLNSDYRVSAKKESVLRRSAETKADCPIKTDCDCEDYEGGLDLW